MLVNIKPGGVRPPLFQRCWRESAHRGAGAKDLRRLRAPGELGFLGVGVDPSCCSSRAKLGSGSGLEVGKEETKSGWKLLGVLPQSGKGRGGPLMVAASHRRPNMNADGTDFLKQSVSSWPNSFERRGSCSFRVSGYSPSLVSGNPR
jgi:hypothetical protein